MSTKITIDIEHEKIFSVKKSDESLLDISLNNGIPHLHACGGNARCSTCRVAIVKGFEHLNEPNELEIKLAKKRNFPENIRLACQTVASGDITVRRLVIDDEDMNELDYFSEGGTGRETRLAILFCDVRNFTEFTESNLPYDVVHLLNRYFSKMGTQILENGGYIDKYMGDGIMALFGLEGGTPEEICLSAVKCAQDMISSLKEVNAYACKHLEYNVNMGIGIHYGDVIAGEMGHPEKKQFTALGDNVNVASRIESKTKQAGAKILISEQVNELIPNEISRGRTFKTKLKGKTGHHRLIEILAKS